jgi:hypothetical protein
MSREIMGYLGRNGTLYCSNACAIRAGQPDASAVDLPGYDEMTERDGLEGDLVCPVCGSPYRVSWPGRDRE